MVETPASRATSEMVLLAIQVAAATAYVNDISGFRRIAKYFAAPQKFSLNELTAMNVIDNVNEIDEACDTHSFPYLRAR